MIHWLQKIFATKTITPRRDQLEKVMSDIDRIKKQYESIDMECIDYELIPSEYHRQVRKDNDILTTTYHDMYAIVYLAPKSK